MEGFPSLFWVGVEVEHVPDDPRQTVVRKPLQVFDNIHSFSGGVRVLDLVVVSKLVSKYRFAHNINSLFSIWKQKWWQLFGRPRPFLAFTKNRHLAHWGLAGIRIKKHYLKRGDLAGSTLELRASEVDALSTKPAMHKVVAVTFKREVTYFCYWKNQFSI